MEVVKKRKLLLLIAAIKRRLSLFKSIYAAGRVRNRCVLPVLINLCTEMPVNFLESVLSKRPPSIWAFPRPQYAFQEYLNSKELENPNYWKDNFRMSKETFLLIVNIARPFMTPMSNCVRQPVILEKRVAIVLNWLSSGSSYNQVGQLFGVHKSTVIKLIKMFINGMMPLRDQFIRFPHTPSEIEKCINIF